MEFFFVRVVMPAGLVGSSRTPSLGIAFLSRFNHFYTRFDFLFRNQRRPIGDDLFHFWPSPSKTCHTRRPSQHQGRDFFCESLDGGAIFTAHANAQLNLIEVASRRSGEWAMS